MKQYIVTEEQIKAVEGLFTSMCDSYGKPASLQAAIVAVTAGLRNHEYVEQEPVKQEPAWINPNHWIYTYMEYPLTPYHLKELGKFKQVNSNASSHDSIGYK